MVSLLVRAATSFYGALLLLRAKRSSGMQSSDSRGFLFLFLRLLHFVRNVFFSSVAKNKKIKSKNNNHTYYEHFFARTLQSSIIAREEKDAKGVKVERYRRVVCLCFFTSERQIFIVGASVI